METVFAFNFTNETCFLRSLFAVEVTGTQAIPFDICIRPRIAFSIPFCSRNVYGVIFSFRIFFFDVESAIEREALSTDFAIDCDFQETFLQRQNGF